MIKECDGTLINDIGTFRARLPGGADVFESLRAETGRELGEVKAARFDM